ncbi:hypothetical protein QJS10_CPA08g00929 [Acorus calamus]|uniref:DUF4283 domain-containing protein n=1 Tax=Acorus calamus TaxID=4465 RepID=A0AAV9EFX1_ACOCL|nr:hypothetical protein QJS10_CPA08g00929 [Acorus calamus]
MYKPPLMEASPSPKAWNELFQKPSDAGKHFSLEFMEPALGNGIPKICIGEEDYESSVAKWEKAVVGYVIGKLPIYMPFLAFLKKLWKIKDEFQHYLQGNYFFVVNFDLEEDLNRVLEGGTWTMDIRHFVLKKWSPSAPMEQESLTSIPIWVKFPNLPLHFWTKECMGKIASAVGIPLFMDTATQMATRISYARVCVEVLASSVLPDSVVIDSQADGKEVFPTVYDWKPQSCSHCLTFGHDDTLCSKRPRLISIPSKSHAHDGITTREKGDTSHNTNNQPPAKDPK